MVKFLRALRRHGPGMVLVIWDGAATHRCRVAQAYLQTTQGQLVAERLPAYAPELNPAEYMWGHLKQHEIANRCAKEGWPLSLHASAALRRMRRRPRILRACFAQATLWP